MKQYSRIYFTAITVVLLLLFSTARAMELQSFEANLNGEQVDVKWVTNSTANSGVFTLERATDGDNFETVITSTAGGAANMLVEYFEVDFNPQKGVSYYRLKQTDADGNVSYSGVVPVEYTDSGEPGLSIFSNPKVVDRAAALEAIKGKEVAVKLREKGGEEVFTDIVVTKSGAQLTGHDPAGELNAGTYLIVASSENILYSRKLIVR